VITERFFEEEQAGDLSESEENFENVMIREFFFFPPTPAVSKASHGRDLVGEKEAGEARTFCS